MRPIAKGIYTALSEASAVTTLLGGTFIYRNIAPQNKSMPYVVYFLSGGGEENSSPRDELDEIWTIFAVTDDAVIAGSLQYVLRTTLHRTDLTLEDNWNTWQVTHQSALEFIDAAERHVTFQAGGSYRIRAVKES